MITVGNFTPDPIEWWDGGVNGVIQPGEVINMDEARANHILNKFDRIGLVRLEFGDEANIAEKKAAAMKRWREFWELQIQTFNQLNEMRKNENKPYLFPTEEMSVHAEKLGVQLLQPWKVTPVVNTQEMEEMKLQLSTLTAQVTQLTMLLTQSTLAATSLRTPEAAQPARASAAPDWDKILSKYKHCNVKTLENAVLDDYIEISNFPDEILAVIEEKWINTYGREKPWPIKK